jgi:hypothetical protein
MGLVGVCWILGDVELIELPGFIDDLFKPVSMKARLTR